MQETEPQTTEPQTTAEIAASEEKSTMLRRFIVIGIIIFGAIFYFVWQNFLNFGHLEIRGDAPYSVFIFDDKTYECAENPCDLKLKRGEKDLIFSKAGYTAPSKQVEIKLWDTVTTNAFFEREPYYQEIQTFPEEPAPPPENITYKFIYDKTSHNWKLIEEGDEKEFALTYFAEKLQNPSNFGTNDSVLIIEKEIHFIDLLSKKRTAIAQASEIEGEITDVIPSFNGEYFLIHTAKEDQNLYYIADSNKLVKTEIAAAPENVYWTHYTTLAIAYETPPKWVFSVISPETLEEKVLLETDEAGEKSPLKSFFPSPTTRKVYFSTEESLYEIFY